MEQIPLNLQLVSQYISSSYFHIGQITSVWIYTLSDGFIAISYYLIAWALIYFLRSREYIPHKSMVILFCVFILACGTTYIFDLCNLSNMKVA